MLWDLVMCKGQNGDDRISSSTLPINQMMCMTPCPAQKSNIARGGWTNARSWHGVSVLQS